MLCPCCSLKPFDECCQPFISGHHIPTTAEALMRSRFSAYASEHYQYIVDTYAEEQRRDLSVEAIARHDLDTAWLSLSVLKAGKDTVEFIATYRVKNAYFRMHERSQFVIEEDKWKYLTGEMLQQTGAFKPGRNDPCLCQSGKKFKKCCG